MTYENQGTAYDRDAYGYELPGRRSQPTLADVTTKVVADCYASGARFAANDNTDPATVFIGTYTGRFYPFAPRPDDFTLEDVAHGLANLCRYTGQCQRRFSVAEHSVLMARWLSGQGATTDEQMCALMHDAPETLSGFGDVARPSKQFAPIIKQTEDTIWRMAVAPKFGLPMELPACVHEADGRIIADEMAQNMLEVNVDDEPLGVTLQFWNPDRAEMEFTSTYWAIVEQARP